MRGVSIIRVVIALAPNLELVEKAILFRPAFFMVISPDLIVLNVVIRAFLATQLIMSLVGVGSGLVNRVICWSLVASQQDVGLKLAHIEFSTVSLRGLAKVVTLLIPGGRFLLNLISRLGQILIVHHFLVNPIVLCNVKLLHHLAI
jgi:hypothetical protein